MITQEGWEYTELSIKRDDSLILVLMIECDATKRSIELLKTRYESEDLMWRGEGFDSILIGYRDDFQDLLKQRDDYFRS